MPDLEATGRQEFAPASSSWIDSSESATHTETTATDGILAVGVSSEYGDPATVTVTVTDPHGGITTHIVESPNSDANMIPANRKVQVAYVGGAGCRGRVDWEALSQGSVDLHG
jgi:hypothetical protein